MAFAPRMLGTTNCGSPFTSMSSMPLQGSPSPSSRSVSKATHVSGSGRSSRPRSATPKSSTSSGVEGARTGGHSRRAGRETPKSPSLSEERLYSENALLGELVMSLREERDAERAQRLASETRERETVARLERECIAASTSARTAKAKDMEAREETEIREELEMLALDLQDQVKEYKSKADRFDDMRREMEAERQKRLLMEEVIAASPEGRHIAVLNSKCEELEDTIRRTERLAASSEEEAAECRREVARLRDEAAGREALLEQELDLSRAAEEEEIKRLRSRVRALKAQGDALETRDDVTRRNHDDKPVSPLPPAISQSHKLETTTEMHLHALALIRDRSRLLRRLHRSEADVMLLRGQVHKLESSLASGGELTERLIAAATSIAAELGMELPDAVSAPDANLESVETIVRHIRPIFLTEAPLAPLSSLPAQMLVSYTRCLEDALVQSRADTVTLRQTRDATHRETMEMSGMLKEATEREMNGAELLRVEINRAKEVEKLHQEAVQEIQYLEEQKFKMQQEAWRLRDLLSEHGIPAANTDSVPSL